MSLNGEFWQAFSFINQTLSMLQSGAVSGDVYKKFLEQKQTFSNLHLPPYELRLLSDLAMLADSEFKSRLNKYSDSTGG